MNWWQRLTRFSKDEQPSPAFRLDERLLPLLRETAARERRSLDEVANALLRQGLYQQQAQQEAWERWRRLTPREQDVVALISLNRTSRQIAAQLSISPETVKTYAHNALKKFEAANRRELRERLAGWDFSAWENTGESSLPRPVFFSSSPFFSPEFPPSDHPSGS